MSRQGILLQQDELGIWDLDFQEGKVVVGPSDQQHIEMILQSAPGHWREHPLLGADVEALLSGNATLTELRARVNVQMQLDEYSSNNVQLDKLSEDDWQLVINLENPDEA